MPIEYLRLHCHLSQRGRSNILPSFSIIGSKMSEANKIAAYTVTRAPDGPEVAFEDLWKDSRCVIVFLRRFG